MKNLNRKIIGGNDVLAKGNNKKFLVYDNFYRNKFTLDSGIVNEISITFYDIANAKTLLNVTDENDVSQWNTVLEYGDNGAFIDVDYNPIVFESVTVEGNKITLVPENQNYESVFGFDWYAYGSQGEDLIETFVISYENINVGWINLDDAECARTINTENFNLIDGFVLDNSNRGISTFDDTGLENITGLNLNSNTITNLTINNLNNINLLQVSNNSLNETSVDAIIAKCVANNINNGRLYLDGGTNATPSAQGLSDIAILDGRGWLVFYNA